MKKLLLGLLFIPLILQAQIDRRDSELQQRYRFALSDRIRLISTNGSGGYTNFTISGQNLLDSFGGVITNNTGTLSNGVTANITNILSATIVTNYLDSTGDTIRFISAGSFLNNANAKSIFVALGGTTLFQSTNILQTTAGTNWWSLEGELIRLGSASYVSSVRFFCLAGSAIAGVGTNYSASQTSLGIESLLTNNTLAIQTRAITQGDVTNNFLQLRNYPILTQ
jgi:hypothetical protein